MTDKNQILEEILQAMLTDNVIITARAAVRLSNGVFKHATDITRNDVRRKMVEDYTSRQEKIKTAIERSSRKSRSNLEQVLARKNSEIERLQSDKTLLIASHRAIILSLAEMGGFPIWKKFFGQYQSVIDDIEKMGALSKADIVPLSGKGNE